MMYTSQSKGSFCSILSPWTNSTDWELDLCSNWWTSYRPPWDHGKLAILEAANSPCTGPARTWFLCKTWCLWIQTTLYVKEGLDAKTLVLFKPPSRFKPKHVCKPGFWKRPYWERPWKRPHLERLCVQKMFSTKASGSSIGYKKRRSKPWQTQPKNGNNHRNDSKMCKTKPVLSEAWAELSPPQCKERWRRNE